ncbi:hypothetical protein F6X42_42155 [Paraburkholderia sp. WC7.3b]|uniref:Uncharacterized protein n=2 Tax=Burkholderiaceae TaxID=119060 RepID=A0ABR7Q2D3_9BURK|nr:hypothetical protein [Paraburkholderia podalyriae]
MPAPDDAARAARGYEAPVGEVETREFDCIPHQVTRIDESAKASCRRSRPCKINENMPIA